MQCSFVNKMHVYAICKSLHSVFVYSFPTLLKLEMLIGKEKVSYIILNKCSFCGILLLFVAWEFHHYIVYHPACPFHHSRVTYVSKEWLRNTLVIPSTNHPLSRSNVLFFLAPYSREEYKESLNAYWDRWRFVVERWSYTQGIAHVFVKSWVAQSYRKKTQKRDMLAFFIWWDRWRSLNLSWLSHWWLSANTNLTMKCLQQFMNFPTDACFFKKHLHCTDKLIFYLVLPEKCTF